MFTIFTDTSANIPTEIAKKHKIHIIPFSYYIDDREYCCENTQEFDGKAFFEQMRSGQPVTTSQITPQRYIDHMEPVLEKGEDILFVGLSSGVSGSYASAENAAEILRQKYPHRKIRLVDSLGASLGEGLLVLKAVDLRDRGISLEEIAALLLSVRERMYQVFTVDNLSYLKRSGRLSNFSTFVGTLLHIKPILKGDEHGKIIAFAKLRGRKHAVHALVEKYNALVLDAENQRIGISHADCPEDAEYLLELIQKNHPAKEVLVVCHEPVTGSHVGPGTLALYFEGDPDVRRR